MNNELFCILISILSSILSAIFFNILYYSIKFFIERKKQNHENQSNSRNQEDR